MSEKKEWALRPGRGPVVTRRVHGKLMEMRVRPQSEEQVMDDLLAGVTRQDMASGLSGFGQHAASQKKQAGPRDLTTIPDGGLIWDEPESDLLMQPDGTPPKEEGDFVNVDAPRRRNQTDQDSQLEDSWSLDLLEDYNDRDQEKGHDGPLTFDRKGGSNQSLDDEIEDLFK